MHQRFLLNFYPVVWQFFLVGIQNKSRFCTEPQQSVKILSLGCENLTVWSG